MKIKIKRFDTSLPLPTYQTAGATCVDLYAREDTTIEAGEVGYIPLNIAIEIPDGYWTMIAPRGSTHKHGLMCANSFGIGDWDFRGDNDEYMLASYNFKKEPVTISKGTRIAQMMVVAYERMEFEEVKKLGNKDRGKFGSTGRK